MDKISGLVALLETPGTRVHCFDMGRRITELPRLQFHDFERTLAPYPYPLKNQAWFGLCRVDQKNLQPPMIWFLNLPLDEQGKLVLATRDYFIHRLLDAMEQTAPNGHDPLAAAFKDNPHTFKPDENRMAVFNARVSTMLNLPPSGFYAHAKEYFCGKAGWDQWQFVGYQGIADISMRIDTPEIQDCLVAAIPELPDEPLRALCHCLENQIIPTRLSLLLLKKLQHLLSSDNVNQGMVSAVIRGMSQPENSGDHQQMLQLILDSLLRTDIEILVAISGRGWEILKLPDNALLFLEALAENPGGQHIFEEAVRDLLAVPGMRKPLLDATRQPACSSLLTSRMATLVTVSP